MSTITCAICHDDIREDRGERSQGFSARQGEHTVSLLSCYECSTLRRAEIEAALTERMARLVREDEAAEAQDGRR